MRCFILMRKPSILEAFMMAKSADMEGIIMVMEECGKDNGKTIDKMAMESSKMKMES